MEITSNIMLDITSRFINKYMLSTIPYYRVYSPLMYLDNLSVHVSLLIYIYLYVYISEVGLYRNISNINGIIMNISIRDYFNNKWNTTG